MTLFYFDVDDGEHFSRDTIGIECRDLATVRWEAIKALPDIAREVLPDGDRHEIKTTVREAGGKAIFTASLSLVAQWFD